jgi:5-methylcytosine-specific restriction endonuclease McrA
VILGYVIAQDMGTKVSKVPLIHGRQSGVAPKVSNAQPPAANSSSETTLLQSPRARALMSAPFPCPNCNGITTSATVFCSGLCEDEASFVRYYRACLEDGRCAEPDIQYELNKRLKFLVAGGYPERERRLPTGIRQAVIARDRGLCCLCGAPSIEIDHIRGNSPDLNNLQLLCKPCHNDKTDRSFVPASAESVPGKTAKREQLLFRVFSDDPGLLCDDPVGWKYLSRRIRSARGHLISERRIRRDGRNCPVCLSKLLRNPPADYRKTGEKRRRRCLKCEAKRMLGITCVQCRAEAVWTNSASAACQACGASGATQEVVAVPLLN